MKLITKALDDVDRADVILQKKEIIALFIQTMEASILRARNLIFVLTLAGLGLFGLGSR